MIRAIVSLFVIGVLFSEILPQNNFIKISGTPQRTYLNANLLSTVLKNDGTSDIDIYEQNSGLVYPKGSGKATMFQSGFIWGAKVSSDSSIRVGGSRYSSGLQPGRILNSGLPWEQLTAEDINAANVRIFRVRRDVYPGGPVVKLNAETNDEGKAELEICARYELDWNEWPAEKGAPFEDINSDGIYNPVIDIPGYAGAQQTIWFIANDLSYERTQFFISSKPIGIELQVTVWAYSQPGSLDHMFFKRYKLINKSNEFLDSIYISVWSDPDVGNSTDDFAGCDTILNLAYAYNAYKYDATYLLSPPAIGFKLLRGPKNHQNGSVVRLPMTSFNYQTRGLNIHEGGYRPIEYYNLMKGRDIRGNFYTDPLTDIPTIFPLSGDPIAKHGWFDGISIPPEDRRMMLNSGPFQMAPSDTQEVVFAEIAALGGDNLNALKWLRYYSVFAETLYNNAFNFTPTIVPDFKKSPLQVHQYLGSIELLWNNGELNSTIENYENNGFTFQGYNVYQFYSEIDFPMNGKLIATFDKIDGITQISGTIMNPETGFPTLGVQQNGSDAGIIQVMKVNKDYINNSHLRPGDKYYYGVTAYFYNSQPSLKMNNYEVPVAFADFIFQKNLPGPSVGDTITTIHSLGNGESGIEVKVVDPYALTGHNYKIYFTPFGCCDVLWNMRDLTLGIDVLTNQIVYEENSEILVADGVQIRITRPFGFKLFSVVANANGPINPPTSGAFSLRGFPTPQDLDPISGIQQATNFSRWGIHSSDINHKGTYKVFLDEVTSNGTLCAEIVPYDFEIRFTANGSKAIKYFDNKEIVDVPFELWNIGIKTLEDTGDDYRLVPWIYENNGNLVFDISGDHSVSSGNNDPFTDWFYWIKPQDTTAGQSGYLLAEQQMMAGTYSGDDAARIMEKMVLVNWNGGTAPGPYNATMPEMGTIFRIQTILPIFPGKDEFIFSTERLDTLFYFPDYTLEQNYPNPFNSSTTIGFKLITRVDVRIDIFNSIGERVTTLIDTEMDPGIYRINFNAASLASGFYFYQIRAGSFYKTKKMVLLK